MQSVKLKPNVLYFLISVMRKAVLNDELQSMHGISKFGALNFKVG